MIINIGNEHKGESCTEVVLKDPSYVKWLFGQKKSDEQLMQIKKEMKRLIFIFNSKPFLKKCFGDNCGELATRCTTYKDNVNVLYWWCNGCNPYQSGASMATLYAISTYENVLGYVNNVCQHRKTDYVALIQQLAQEKGLPNRADMHDIDIFFKAEV